MDKDNTGYGKRPLWQWIVIYVVIGLVVYGLIYYFVIAKNNRGFSYSPVNTVPMTASPSTTQTQNVFTP